MPILKPSAIKEIAREIARGNTCYVHRFTTKITTIDHTLDDQETLSMQESTIAQFERDKDNYVILEKLSAEDQLNMMKQFLDELQDKSLRKQLSNALNRKNPIRNFNQAIESDMELNQHWGNFSLIEYQRWVSNFIIDAYNF